MTGVQTVLFRSVQQDVGRTFMYIWLYVSAYMYRNRKIDTAKSKIVLILSMIGLFAIRIIVRKFLDGTILYNTIVVCFTQILLTYNMYWFLNEMFKNVRMERNAFINHLDLISYYVYIVHMMFITGPVRTMGITKNMIINSVITIGLAWVMGILLYKITNLIFHLTRKEF